MGALDRPVDRAVQLQRSERHGIPEVVPWATAQPELSWRTYTLRYIVDFQSLNPFLPTYIRGIGMTVLFSSLAICLSFALGIPWVAMRMSSNRLASRVARGYVEFVRNVPLLV